MKHSANGVTPRIAAQEIHSNNLANVDTAGFKRDMVFVELLNQMTGEREERAVNLRMVTNFTQGSLKETGSPLDVAINGQGFFLVRTPSGLCLTRNGSFTLDEDGNLVTQQGYRVMGAGGEIKLGEGSPAISEDGGIFIEGVEVERLKVVEVADKNTLIKAGDGLFSLRTGGAPNEGSPGDFEVKQGFLEGSNVEPVREMVEMMNDFREYEANMRALMIQDRTLEKATGEVGKV
jgi:flagellar basal-body rod protein FlgG